MADSTHRIWRGDSGRAGYVNDRYSLFGGDVLVPLDCVVRSSGAVRPVLAGVNDWVQRGAARLSL